MKQRNFRKSNAGFTLVELIVVIAIMAILAGVGTVGYSAYIKQANKKADITTVGNILRAIDTGSYAYKIDDRLQVEGSNVSIPVGIITLTNEENASAIEANSEGNTKTDGVLNDVLVAAYGENYNIKLKSDEWTSNGIPSFYTGSVKLWENVESLSKTASTLSKIPIINVMGQKYDSGEALVMSFANKVAGDTQETTKNNFVSAWVSAYDNNAAIDYNFGFSNREDYSAARTAYNNCVATYIANQNVVHYKDIKNKVTASGDEASHVKKIREFGEGISVSGKTYGLPKLVCLQAFDSSYSDTQLPEEVRDCETCKNLYEQYHTTGMDKTDAEAFYDMMVTIKNTGSAASASKDFWGYYKTYLQEFDNLYSEVVSKTTNKSAIVIIVTYKDGVLNYEVSPSTANPRDN